MTEAGWTRNAPTKEGWYWWRNLLTDNAPEVWAIVDHGDGLEVIGPFDETALDEWVSDMGGEWLGPITPDSYQQGRVEGLREAAGMVDDDCYIPGGELLPDFEHRCKHNVNQKELAGKIRFRANDLAQQAQKGVAL